MPQPGVIWLIAVVVFMIVEAVTYQMVSIWFACGAMGGLIAYVCGAKTGIQIGIFIILSVVLLALLRPVSIKLAKNRKFKSNAAGLEGKNILITQEVNNIEGAGQGKISGMVWTVRTADDGVIIPAGELAKIVKIEGVKLIVEKI